MTNERVPATADSNLAFVTELERAVTTPVLKLMLQSSYLAIERALIDEAETIADGLAPLMPWYAEIEILKATVSVAANRPAEGLALLERLIAKEPGLHSAVCACAMLKKDLGLGDWRSLAHGVIESAQADPASKQAARGLLDLPSGTTAAAGAVRGATAQQAGLRFVR